MKKTLIQSGISTINHNIYFSIIAMNELRTYTEKESNVFFLFYLMFNYLKNWYVDTYKFCTEYIVAYRELSKSDINSEVFDKLNSLDSVLQLYTPTQSDSDWYEFYSSKEDVIQAVENTMDLLWLGRYESINPQ